ncbi:hypothetical protein A2U01_0052972, partial [Trifolium medium]|nr:hypothetical protein [Trifolium medium]
REIAFLMFLAFSCVDPLLDSSIDVNYGGLKLYLSNFLCSKLAMIIPRSCPSWLLKIAFELDEAEKLGLILPSARGTPVPCARRGLLVHEAIASGFGARKREKEGVLHRGFSPTSI